MSELQLLILYQIRMYEYALNNFGPKAKAKAKARLYYERMRKEALSDLLELQLKEFNHN
jgi:hypothetical protein